jgi:DNA-binding NarL/FixJ family response regulator
MAIKVYIVEDHPELREALGMLVEYEPALELCGSAATGEEALAQLADTGAQVVLVDMFLPQMNGADLIMELQTQWPDLRCVVLSGHTDTSYVERALAAGARGYILKGNPDEVLEAIQHVMAGGIYLSPLLRHG